MPRKIDAKSAKQVLKILKSKRDGLADLKDSAFEKQETFINDPAKLKAAICTRRSGKSFGVGLYLFREAMENPGVSVLYVALTRDSAKRIMYKDVLKVINRKYNLGATFNEVDLYVKCSNGSVIYLVGANASVDEPEKLLGQKFKLVCIDECASFTQDLRKLVYGVLKPAVMDYNGTIAMIGTPGNLAKGLFFDVTQGNEPGWSVHKWTAMDNPHMAKKWQKEIADMVAANPAIAETPLFKQHYLGQWFVDYDRLVYKYSEDRNKIDSLPTGTWQYVLGVDLGYNDPTAFVVVAFKDYDPNLYVVESSSYKKLIISSVASKIQELRAKYNFNKMVVDSASKQAVEEIRQRYQLPLEAAEKTDKAGFITMMNSDYITGKIQIVKEQNLELLNEYSSLVWREDSEKLEENPSCDNHCSDALLYAWRYSRNYLAGKRPGAKPSIHSEEYLEEWWNREAAKLEKKEQESFLERDWSEAFE